MGLGGAELMRIWAKRLRVDGEVGKGEVGWAEVVIGAGRCGIPSFVDGIPCGVQPLRQRGSVLKHLKGVTCGKLHRVGPSRLG